MIGYGLIIFRFDLIGRRLRLSQDSQKKKPLSEDRLKFWLGQMAKPTGGRVQKQQGSRRRPRAFLKMITL